MDPSTQLLSTLVDEGNIYGKHAKAALPVQWVAEILAAYNPSKALELKRLAEEHLLVCRNWMSWAGAVPGETGPQGDASLRHLLLVRDASAPGGFSFKVVWQFAPSDTSALLTPLTPEEKAELLQPRGPIDVNELAALMHVIVSDVCPYALLQ